jgi:hypothetical protein
MGIPPQVIEIIEEGGPVIEEEAASAWEAMVTEWAVLAPKVEAAGEAIETEGEEIAAEVEAEGETILNEIEEGLGEGEVDAVTTECEPTAASVLENSEFNGVEADRVLAGSSDRIAVIGRSMSDAVEPYAEGLQEEGYNVETFSNSQISRSAQDEWESLKELYGGRIPEDVIPETQMFQENEAWAQKLVDEGYTVVDVDNPGEQGASQFYEMEKTTIFGSGGE